jgi:PhnB protein
MEKIALNAYLMFKGDCREAMNFYQSVFGGDVNIMTYGDMDGSCPEAKKNQVMHGQLMGGDAELMAADDPENIAEGNSRIQLALSGANKEKLTDMFNALSAGGQVQVPLAKQAWGDEFGMFSDKYGIKWMVNIGAPKG